MHKIALISGVFDLCHKGHRFILTEIKKQSDYLIVCLNSDSYIRTKKNREPQWIFEKRKEALIKTGLVDEVIEIEDSPLEVIKMIHPAQIWVGNDYKPEQVVGYKEVSEWGGEIKIIDRLPNISTTAILKNIKSQEEQENDELIACFTGKLKLKQRQ